MKQISTKTASQVLVNFEIATLGHRIGAFAIDMLILFGAILVIALLADFLEFTGDGLGYLTFFMFLFYTLVFEIATGGSTPGKRAIGLRVLKFSGSPASVLDYVIRWVFRWVDIWMSMGVVGAAFCISSPYGQRLGDVLAGTTLVKFDKKEKVALSDILEMKSKKDYEPSYPQVEMMSDANMLLVKSAILRYQKSTNQAYSVAIAELADKLKSELKIDKKTGEPVTFLRQLLKDYVVLTR